MEYFNFGISILALCSDFPHVFVVGELAINTAPCFKISYSTYLGLFKFYLKNYLSGD